MSALLILALLLQTSRDGAAAQPTRDTAAIGGTVSTSGVGGKRALSRAVVSLSGTGVTGVRQAVTDDRGRFVFDRVAPGRFTLVVEKPGYLKTYHGSRQPGRPPAATIAVVEGQRLLDIAIDVPKGSVLDGTVRDENGVPLPSSQVTALRVVSVMGQRQFVNAFSESRWATTDDRGHFRIFGLPPGEYTVNASETAHGFPAFTLTESELKAAEKQLQTGQPPAPGAAATGPRVERGPVFYPGVADPTMAQTITLGLGEERLGVDLVNSPMPAYSIEFHAVGPSGLPISPEAQIAVASLSGQSIFMSQGFVRADTTGHGVLRRVPPGRYLFFGRGREASDPGSEVYWLSAEVDATAGDVTGVLLQFLPGQRVSGRLRPAGATSPVIAAGARVQLNPAPLIAGASIGTPTADVKPDGTFSVMNVPPGRYRLELGGVRGWTPVSAISRGVDTLDVPLEVQSGLDVDDLVVSVTDKLTEISGLITDSAGRPTPELTVLVFSQDRGLWTSPRRFSGATRIASDGKYRISGLPPGNYFLAVVTDVDSLQVTDPIFLEQLMTGAVPIRLADGQKVVQDLKIGG